MEKMEQDLRFFKQELLMETNQFRRNLLLEEIKNVETCILDLLILLNRFPKLLV